MLYIYNNCIIYIYVYVGSFLGHHHRGCSVHQRHDCGTQSPTRRNTLGGTSHANVLAETRLHQKQSHKTHWLEGLPWSRGSGDGGFPGGSPMVTFFGSFPVPEANPRPLTPSLVFAERQVIAEGIAVRTLPDERSPRTGEILRQGDAWSKPWHHGPTWMGKWPRVRTIFNPKTPQVEASQIRAGREV